MDYRTVLKTDVVQNDLVVDNSYKTCDDALSEYREICHRAKEQLYSRKQQEKFLPPPVNEALGNIHVFLSQYWSQFGILDKCSQAAFFDWARKNLNFKDLTPKQSGNIQADRATDDAE